MAMPPEPEPPSEDEDEHGALRELLDPLIRFHYEHPVYFWLATTAIITAILTVGSIVAPEIFLHEFLWKNFWGPTVADANQTGVATRYGMTVSEDYTLLSEIIYGLILAGALTSIYIHLFKKRGIDVDGRFIASLLPYIFFGPLARSMEDASVFCEAGTTTIRQCEPGIFSTVFISPFIYVLTAVAVIAHLYIAYYTRNRDQATRDKVIGAWLLAQVAGYAAIWAGFADQFVIIAQPLTFAALAALAFVIYAVAVRRGGKHQTWAMASLGIPMALLPMVLIARWELGTPWLDPIRPRAKEVIPVVAGLTLLVVAVLVLIAFLLRREAPDWAAFLSPLNIGLVAGHMVDGFATFTAICSSKTSEICGGAKFLGVETQGYGEKHPVSEFFLNFADGWGFPLMKLLLVGLIVVLIDRSAREGGEDPRLVGLVKLAVLILGLAPGLRDVARVAMGV